MKAVEFNGVNVRIAENQEEYQTLPARIDTVEDPVSKIRHNVCETHWVLDKEEIEDLQQNGVIKMVQYLPENSNYPPVHFTIQSSR